MGWEDIATYADPSYEDPSLAQPSDEEWAKFFGEQPQAQVQQAPSFEPAWSGPAAAETPAKPVDLTDLTAGQAPGGEVPGASAVTAAMNMASTAPAPYVPPAVTPAGAPATPPPASRLGSDQESQPLAAPPAPARNLTDIAKGTGSKLLTAAENNPGKVAGLGLSALTSAMGMAQSTPTVKTPARTANLTPQEQQAAAALRTATAAASSPTNQATLATLQQRLQDVTTGKVDPVSPQTIQDLDLQKQTLLNQLVRDLGPGAVGTGGEPTSTAAANALQNYDRYRQSVITAERNQYLQTLSSQIQQLQSGAGTAASLELNTLGGPAAQQQALGQQANLQNTLTAQQAKTALLNLGGLTAGLTLAPTIAGYTPRAGA